MQMAAKKKATKKKAVAKKVVSKKKVVAKKVVAKKAAGKKKAVAKKVVSKKKAVAKKVVAKKAAADVKLKKSVTTGIKDGMTKAALFQHLSEVTGVGKKDVVAIFNELNVVIGRHVKKNSVEEFKVPGLMKIKVVTKPARKARKGTNPFTGEEVMFKAKPKSRVIKIQPLKGLKDMA
jgi:nucleoid DNA-binding protein